MRWLADFAYLLAGLVYLPVALYHALIVGKNRRGWRQRFGGVPVFDPNVPRIWIHAVSLGEINATPQLVGALRERLPGTDIVFSTTTDTGFARAVQLYGADHVFRFPLDFSSVIRRVLRRVRPTMIVLVELEVWYNLVRMATRRGIPLAVVNGRLTERSARRLRWLGSIGRSMFRDLAWVGAQDETIAGRFRSVGVPVERIEVTSSLKWDTAAVTDRVEGAEEMARSLGIDGVRSVWVCGSTGPGEEETILHAYQSLLRAMPDASGSKIKVQSSKIEMEEQETSAPLRTSNFALRTSVWPVACAPGPDSNSPVLVLVPRKPERFEEVARLIMAGGFDCVRRCQRPDGTRVAADSAGLRVVLGDTMGELRKFYSLADVVFIGRSLVALGGSDPMEVAALGKPIVTGPHMENFESPVSLLREAGALRVVESAHELAAVIGDLLADTSMREQMGAAAKESVLRNQGATKRTAEQLVGLIPRKRTPRSLGIQEK